MTRRIQLLAQNSWSQWMLTRTILTRQICQPHWVRVFILSVSVMRIMLVMWLLEDLRRANMTPIHWISKRQNTLESSALGSGFITLKWATEVIKGIRYELRILGVSLDGLSRVMCDSQSVVMNSSFPASVFKEETLLHRVSLSTRSNSRWCFSCILENVQN